MADGVLGIAGGGSAALSQDVIDKLKEAESAARIKPLETKIETWDTESAKILEIQALNLELISSLNTLSLDNTANMFEKKSATTSGSAVSYDASDVSGLINGTTAITVTQLAQKDVYQTNVFSDKDAQVIDGNGVGDKITVTVDGTSYDFTTEARTYSQLAAEINANDKLNASVEQVGDSSYRLVIKSAESGTTNALSIAQTGVDLGVGDYNSVAVANKNALLTAGTLTINTVEFNMEDISLADLRDNIEAHDDFNATINADNQLVITSATGGTLTITETGDNGLNITNPNHTVKAQNLKASIDGVAYDVSSNTITTQGSLKITANELGDSSITITQDTGGILASAQDIVTKYNTFVTTIDAELNSSESSLQDKSALRMMKSSMKDILFSSYGEAKDQNIFSVGFTLDTSGFLSIDETIFGKAVTDDFDNLKALFVGTSEDKGLATLLKTYTDDLDNSDGLLFQYDINMMARKTTLDADLLKETEALDAKYDLMVEEFAAYGSIIATMEAQFSSLKMMIDQSIASN